MFWQKLANINCTLHMLEYGQSWWVSSCEEVIVLGTPCQPTSPTSRHQESGCRHASLGLRHSLNGTASTLLRKLQMHQRSVSVRDLDHSYKVWDRDGWIESSELISKDYAGAVKPFKSG